MLEALRVFYGLREMLTTRDAPMVAGARCRLSNKTIVKEVEFGMCTVTCGIGIREVILTSGCPGGESKCIVRVEECRGPVDCGWGRPISESLEHVRLACVHTSPENRFKYIWRLLRPDQQAIILANDSAILEVHRDTHPKAFECETLDNNEIVASIRFTIYTTTGELNANFTGIMGFVNSAHL
ncbi:hypothetical protein E5288_WYG003366 [Bos mutus]|uniref:Sperm acrosome membrane-associated protein 1 n=1 Tax=Bos mutus TaxID=72004 RepID=A0A6B0RMY5_9CETA|nr:hypothetical protein [Bos mutus]